MVVSESLKLVVKILIVRTMGEESENKGRFSNIEL